MRIKVSTLILLTALACLCPAAAYAWSGPAENTAYHFAQIEGKNVVIVSTYSTWIGPDQKWPIATDSNDEWEATVRAHSADGKLLGTIEVPQSVNGRVDYSSYLEHGFKYIVVTQASGAESDKYFPALYYPDEENESETQQGGHDSDSEQVTEGDRSKNAEEPKESSTKEIPPTKTADEEDPSPETQTGDPLPEEITEENLEDRRIESAHIIFTKIANEDRKIRAQIDNGQYGKDWWGVWDISTEGEWASKVYVLDADKNVLGQLSIPESALGVLDYHVYRKDAAYIQVEHSTCVGIYEISTGKTIAGTLDDIIGEEQDPGNNKINYLAITAIVLIAVFIAALLFILLRRRN